MCKCPVEKKICVVLREQKDYSVWRISATGRLAQGKPEESTETAWPYRSTRNDLKNSEVIGTARWARLGRFVLELLSHGKEMTVAWLRQ